MIEDYIAVDLEMTGLDAKRDRIIEIGAVRVCDGAVRDTYQAMVNPHMQLPEDVVALTGITNDMARRGRELAEVLEEFLEFCADAVLLGHNVMFDYRFLKQAVVNQRMEYERMGIDTLKIARKLLPQEEKKTLKSLCTWYQIREGRAHRALDDALSAHYVYQKMMQQFGQQHPEMFEARPLLYRVKRQTPAGARQKQRLKELAAYHQVDLQLPWETLTKNEASRQIDKILARYGKMK